MLSQQQTEPALVPQLTVLPDRSDLNALLAEPMGLEQRDGRHVVSEAVRLEPAESRSTIWMPSMSMSLSGGGSGQEVGNFPTDFH